MPPNASTSVAEASESNTSSHWIQKIYNHSISLIPSIWCSKHPIQSLYCPTMAMDVIALSSPINKFILNNNNINNYPKFCLQTRRRAIDEQAQLNSAKPFRAYPSLFVKYGSTQVCEAKAGGNGTPDRQEDDEMDAALHLDGQIPDTSDEFVKQVSSRAYDMRRKLKQSIDSSSYDVLEANPWRGDSREDSKAVYVLAQGENQIWTMRTRRPRSEVEHELGMLFPKQGKKRTENGSQRKNSGSNTRFRMLVEDVREGVLVFEDENDAVNYCNLLENQHGQGCAGVAELDASSVFDLCRKMKALAVLFRRGRAHPLPDNLELDLKARKRSLEDQE